MQKNPRLDEIRGNVIQQIDRNQRNFKLALLAAAVWELGLLVAMLLGMERGNRSHLLLLIATVGSYTVIILGLVTLGVYLNGANLRVLKAVELLGENRKEAGSGNK